LVSVFGCAPAFPQASGSQELAELRRQVEAIRAEQEARIAQIRSETAQRLQAIEVAMASMGSDPAVARAAGSASAAPGVVTTAAASNLGQARAAAPAARSSQGTASEATGSLLKRLSSLDVGGDLRLRYESNFGDSHARNRDRGVLRGRLRARYAVTPWLSIGGQLATGDPDDPNSTDVTLSNFVDDLQVSLDQAYLHASFGALQLDGGKFANPFSRTDLVWDGDVSLQGLSASYAHSLAGKTGPVVRLVALYSPIDEQANGPDSDLRGVQAIMSHASSDRRWEFDLAAGYFDYQLRSLAGGDSGDFRTNRLDPSGRRYLSDFNLLDAIAGVTWRGLGEAWPLALRVDRVRNLGASTSADSGIGVDLALGRADSNGHWRVALGYARVETDAVLAAFSHDNTALGTNYRQHSLSVDYSLGGAGAFNVTWYRYRPLTAIDAGALSTSNWLDRIRLNFLVSF
jgi:hypothetical protein